ncbi:prefoldin subunit alpha [archaeon]|jgi:prefoldin alpha subunit|nr:prefoldin subunit alpha [archaeon]
MNNEELTQKFQMFEQQIMQLQQQLQAVEQAILEVSGINLALNELVGKTGEEIMAPVGKGIFVKAKLLSEEILMDVGSKNFVNKSIPETKKIIEEQSGKLVEMKGQLEGELDNINKEITGAMMQAQQQEVPKVEEKEEESKEEK